MRTNKITFNLHTFHNPDCDILEYQLDEDTKICYGVYVNKPKQSKRDINKGDEFMEVYVGENYNINSKKRSYSKCYYDNTDKFPKAHTLLWFQLRNYYKDCKENGTYEKALKEGRKPLASK